MFINILPTTLKRGINLIGLGAPCADALLEPQQREQPYVMFINI